jgi:hypothetical protein
MKDKTLFDLIKDEDFHSDAMGRMVIKNEELFSAINGAMGKSGIFDVLSTNTTCGNVSC